MQSTKMRLSEAILKGYKLTGLPQTKDAMFHFSGPPDEHYCDGMCALGSALVGCTGSIPDSQTDVHGALDREFGDVLHMVMHHPVLDATYTVAYVVTSLNDVWNWEAADIASMLAEQGL